MNYIQKYQLELSKEVANIETYVRANFFAYKPKIKKLIKERWKQGLKPDGTKIGRYFSGEYASEKSKQNPQAGFGNVDLILSGSLVNNIDVLLQNNSIFEVISRDDKFWKIAEKYGDDNFNLSEDQTEVIFKEIENEIINKILDKLWRN